MYQKIMITLDGSQLAEVPLDYAVWLAVNSGAELQLMHIQEDESDKQSQYLEKTLAEIKHDRGNDFKASIVSKNGDPAEEILRYAEESKIDLIIMSTHGHTGIKRWMLGSVADKVVRYSNRPVRLIKSFSSETQADGYDRTVVALLDGSEMAEQLLPYASYHAELGAGRLILLSVCEPPDLGPAITYHLIPPHDYPPKRPLQWDKYVKQEAKQRQQECHLYLEKAAQISEKEGITVKFEAPMGDPVEEILKYLEENSVSLVVMTTRGRSGITRWLMGSVAEKVLLAAQSPILLLKPRG